MSHMGSNSNVPTSLLLNISVLNLLGVAETTVDEQSTLTWCTNEMMLH